MTSLQLWFPAQDWHKIKPVSIPAWMGGGLMSSHSQVEEPLQQLTATSGGEPFFLGGVATDRLPMLPLITPHPCAHMGCTDWTHRDKRRK